MKLSLDKLAFGIFFSITYVLNVSQATVDMGSMTNLQWEQTGCEVDGCAELEFCEASGGVYGYRVPGIGNCGDLGPLIEMEPGKTYKLILTNIASEPANIHTHGLHISGDDTIFLGTDDITKYAPVGGSIEYTWTISSDHMGGTLWYHAHVHGSTDNHVDGGAFGMLIITEQSNISNNANVKLWLQNEIRLVASHSSVHGSAGNGVGGGDVFDIVPGEWYRLRILAVDADGKDQAFTIADTCEVHPVAHDGVWRFSVPKGNPGTSTNTYQLTGSSRLDVAIKCSSQDAQEISFGNGGNPPTVAWLFTTSNTSPSSASPYENGGTWSPQRPYYLANLQSATVDDTYEVSLSGGNMNGQKWNEAVPLRTFTLEDVQEWTISGSANHPFHLHIHHMQIVTPGGCGDIYDEGEYVDTIQSQVGECVVRFRMADFSGRTVMHCHVLSHEDGGAIGWVDVTSSNDLSTYPPTSTPNQAPVTPTQAPVDPTPAPAPTGTMAMGMGMRKIRRRYLKQ